MATSKTSVQTEDKKNEASLHFWNQVTHEVEESVPMAETGGKLGDRLNCSLCKKNPGHKHFIAANEFSPQCLDVWKGKKFENIMAVRVAADHPLMFDFMKSEISLSVRLESTYVSMKRPEVKNYPLSDSRGKELTDRDTGSGRVVKMVELSDCYVCVSCGTEWRVESRKRGVTGQLISSRRCGGARCPDCGGEGERGCRCAGCVDSGRREAKWWRIWIQTARHVIFDTSEARRCHVVLYDDGESQPLELTAGRGAVVRWSDTEWDSCHMFVYTHDSGLAERLKECLRRRDEVREKINKLTESDEGEVIDPAFAIGYPHGRQCYLTLGERMEGEGNAGRYSVKYRVDTCPGNSGGEVKGWWRWWCGDFMSWPRAHSGATDQPGVGTSAGV